MKPRKLVEMVREQADRARVFKVVAEHSHRYHLALGEDAKIKVSMKLSHFLTDHVKDQNVYEHYIQSYLKMIHKHREFDADTFREYLT